MKDWITDPRSSPDSHQNKYKENHITEKTAEIQIKMKILEQPEKNKTYIPDNNYINYDWLFIRNNRDKTQWDTIFEGK